MSLYNFRCLAMGVLLASSAFQYHCKNTHYINQVYTLSHPLNVYMQTFLCLYVSVHFTWVVCSRACYWALSPACWSVRINELQALHLRPGVTDSSSCVSQSSSPSTTHWHTPYRLYHTDTLSSRFCDPVSEGWKQQRRWIGSKEINTWREPINTRNLESLSP